MNLSAFLNIVIGFEFNLGLVESHSIVNQLSTTSLCIKITKKKMEWFSIVLYIVVMSFGIQILSQLETHKGTGDLGLEIW